MHSARCCSSTSNVAALRAQRLIATVDLDQALGGGLELTAPSSDSDSATPPESTSAPTPPPPHP